MDFHFNLKINENIQCEVYSSLDHVSIAYSDEDIFHSIDIPLNELDKTLRILSFLRDLIRETNEVSRNIDSLSF